MKHKRHTLKTWIPYFYHIETGLKTFEVRKDDRNFQVGDTLMLTEYSDITKKYTGNVIECRISYKLVGGSFGIEEGYCILGISNIKLINTLGRSNHEVSMLDIQF